jgi:opacity protein-like surface antigen
VRKHSYVIASVLLVASCLPAAVSAQDVSIAVRGGASWAQDSLEGVVGDLNTIGWGRGYNVGGALGFEFASGVVAEAEFTFLQNPARTERDVPIGGSYRDQLFLANVGYQFGRSAARRVRPYLGIGAGIVRVGQHQQYLDDDDSIVFDEGHWNTVAWQARAGLNFKVADSVALTTGYRFIRVNANDEQEVTGDEVIAVGALLHHSVEVGLSFRF